MVLPEIDASCTNCGNKFRGVPTLSFLGFQKLVCPSCGQEVLYPLTSEYRLAYWGALVLIPVTTISNLAEGAITVVTAIIVSGLLGIMVIKDIQIRKRVTISDVR